jgi:DNA-binding transcriptional MerR regulator
MTERRGGAGSPARARASETLRSRALAHQSPVSADASTRTRTSGKLRSEPLAQAAHGNADASPRTRAPGGRRSDALAPDEGVSTNSPDLRRSPAPARRTGVSGNASPRTHAPDTRGPGALARNAAVGVNSPARADVDRKLDSGPRAPEERARADATLRSGALAREAGVSADTLRFYERRGLLSPPPRDANGYRRYPLSAIDRVIVIQQALAAGFTIAELARILRQRDRGGAPCREVFAIAASRLDALDARIRALTELRATLRRTLAEWKDRLDRTPAGRRAGLLDDLREVRLKRSSDARVTRD